MRRLPLWLLPLLATACAPAPATPVCPAASAPAAPLSMRPPAETATPVDPSLRPAEGDFVLKSFHFESGDTLPELRIHYLTLGTPVRDATGHATNAVLVLHG